MEPDIKAVAELIDSSLRKNESPKELEELLWSYIEAAAKPELEILEKIKVVPAYGSSSPREHPRN